MPPIVTLLTDFGMRDSYVGEVKAVLASQAHPALIIDVTHDIPPGDVRAAQYVLSRVWRRFPQGTVHLVVVDPGVGTERRALAAGAAGHFFLAPDNGLLSSLPAEARFVELPVPPTACPTFHARDLFAPAAADLANGTALTHLGHPIADPIRSPLPQARKEGEAWIGEVVYVDRFGTLITNLPGDRAGAASRVNVGGTDAGPLRRTFGDVASGQIVAFVGSGGTVEIAARDGNAEQLLRVGVGTAARMTG